MADPKQEVKIETPKPRPEGVIGGRTGATINLIPELTKQEKQKIEKKENINLSSAGFIFVVTSLTAAILFGNLYLRSQKVAAQQNLAQASSTLNTYTEKELQIKNANSKYDSISRLREADLQYSYFIEDIGDIPTSVTLSTIALDLDGNFRLSGFTSSVANFDVLHNYLDDHDSFKDLNIGNLKRLTAEEISDLATSGRGRFSDSWSVTGKYFRDTGADQDDSNTDTTNSDTTNSN